MAEINLASAGSLAATMAVIADSFTARSGHKVTMHRGPAGLLTEAIHNGLAADIFVSASPDGPASLHDTGLFEPAHIIARNRTVLLARPGLNGCNDPLALLDDPRLRIGLSTPGADPGGDYATAFLDRLNATDPVRWQNLRERCHNLFGASLPDQNAPPRSSALDALLDKRADLLIIYATTADQIMRAFPGSKMFPLPLALAPLTTICACTKRDCPEPARDLFSDIQGKAAAELLLSNGFFLP